MSYGLRPKSTYESIIKEVINPNLNGKSKIIDRTASNFYKSHEYTKLFNSDHIDLQNQLIDNQKEQMMVSAINGNNGISYVNQRVQEAERQKEEKKRKALEQLRNVSSSSATVVHSMSTGQSDDEIDDDEEMDDAPNVQDPSSSSTSRAKAKELSRNSKKKMAREAKMVKGREEQTTEDPNVETLHPKPPKQPKYDDIGINELTDKKAVLDFDTRKSYWSKRNRAYIRDQILLRGHRFGVDEKKKTHDDLLKLLHKIEDDGL